MYPLSIKTNPEAWRLFAARNHDPKFEKFKQKTLERDNFTCQFCGFQAREFQEVVNLDDDYRNNKSSNLVTACCFCAQCFFIESVGIGEYGGGTLVFLPEITQADLNSFCHVLFCAITNDTGYKASAQSVYRSLRFRSQVIEEKFGDGSSNPGTFGRMLIETNLKDTDVSKSLFYDIRLLPSRTKFRKQIEKWAMTAISELSSENV